MVDFSFHILFGHAKRIWPSETKPLSLLRRQLFQGESQGGAQRGLQPVLFTVANYIDTNPVIWEKDCFFTEE